MYTYIHKISDSSATYQKGSVQNGALLRGASCFLTLGRLTAYRSLESKCSIAKIGVFWINCYKTPKKVYIFL